MTRTTALRQLLARWAVLCTLPLASVVAIPEADADPTELVVKIGYLCEAIPEREPLSLVEVVATDKGLAGARLAIGDNNTTGKFLKQSYSLMETIVPEKGDLRAAASAFNAAGVKLIVAALTVDRLLELAAFPEMQGALIFNIQAQDDSLRVAGCRPNIFHIIPNRAMKADALAQYLISKQWPRWVLISGTEPPDKAFADAIRRAAKRFGGEIVEEREYSFEAGSRRTDTGQQQVRKQMTDLTQRLPDYDVMIVADESDIFGEYLPYRT